MVECSSIAAGKRSWRQAAASGAAAKLKFSCAPGRPARARRAAAPGSTQSAHIDRSRVATPPAHAPPLHPARRLAHSGRPAQAELRAHPRQRQPQRPSAQRPRASCRRRMAAVSPIIRWLAPALLVLATGCARQGEARSRHGVPFAHRRAAGWARQCDSAGGTRRALDRLAGERLSAPTTTVDAIQFPSPRWLPSASACSHGAAGIALTPRPGAWCGRRAPAETGGHRARVAKRLGRPRRPQLHELPELLRNSGHGQRTQGSHAPGRCTDRPAAMTPPPRGRMGEHTATPLFQGQQQRPAGPPSSSLAAAA